MEEFAQKAPVGIVMVAYGYHSEVMGEFCCPSNIEVVQEFLSKII